MQMISCRSRPTVATLAVPLTRLLPVSCSTVLTMARNATRLLCILLVAFLVTSCVSAQRHSVAREGREIIEVEDKPDGIVWLVQLSDLHISAYYPDRASSLQILMGPLLRLINPSLVLITGDLTDAKTKDRTGRRQDETEWSKYQQTMRKVIVDSGLPDHVFYDLRGNHDKFGVPTVATTLDYFSKYSISALRNRTSDVQSVTLKSSGWKHLFVGVDMSMAVGLRGPCNLFGHPTDEQLKKLDLELSQWDACPIEKVTKVVFGHFPMSFAASTERGSRPEAIFAKHSIAAYICGHLHKAFGPNLIKHHLHPKAHNDNSQHCDGTAEGGIGEFWEWELGDWRMLRSIRILAIDHGHTSFSDFDVSVLNATDYKTKDVLPTLVVPTYPLDSQKMERLKQLPYSMTTQDCVRALVFSPTPLVSVVAKFYDTISGKPHLLEELEMHSTWKAANTALVYEAQWKSANYIDSSATRYIYQVAVVDSAGKLTESSVRPFSVHHSVSEAKKTWREFIVFGFVWEGAYTVLVQLAFAVLFCFFIFPKFFLQFLLGNGRYQQWSYCLFRVERQKLTTGRAIEMFVWFFLQGCARNIMWCEQLFLLVWMLLFPWYWGQALADGYPIGFMSLRGWEVRMSEKLPSYPGQGWPDLMLIVLPYLYFVLLPLYTLVFALSAEASLHEIFDMEMPASLKKKEQGIPNKEYEVRSLLSCEAKEFQKGGPSPCVPQHLLRHKPTGCRWVRVLLLGCFMLISFVHFGQVCAVAGAYGYMAVLASPGFAWPVPILMTTAILQSSDCGKQK